MATTLIFVKGRKAPLSEEGVQLLKEMQSPPRPNDEAIQRLKEIQPNALAHFLGFKGSVVEAIVHPEGHACFGEHVREEAYFDTDFAVVIYEAMHTVPDDRMNALCEILGIELDQVEID